MSKEITEKDMIRGCQRHKKSSQMALYERYAPVLLPICIRYTTNFADAEDLLQDEFIKIFDKIKQFKGVGSFEGWLKRIITNAAINNYQRKNKYFVEIDNENIKEIPDDFEDDTELINTISKEQIINEVNNLPNGYKIVFNLYVIEGYSHKEIAETLNISVNTSKSQLSRARKTLQEQLSKLTK